LWRPSMRHHKDNEVAQNSFKEIAAAVEPQHDVEKEEALDDEQLWHQERNFILDQEEPDRLQIKEEQGHS
ncbi:hypothetical protein GOODEAATRI_028989, partial [Goodea atripinnis]